VRGRGYYNSDRGRGHDDGGETRLLVFPREGAINFEGIFWVPIRGTAAVSREDLFAFDAPVNGPTLCFCRAMGTQHGFP
jgi:hypothetical protein